MSGNIPFSVLDTKKATVQHKLYGGFFCRLPAQSFPKLFPAETSLARKRLRRFCARRFSGQNCIIPPVSRRKSRKPSPGEASLRGIKKRIQFRSEAAGQAISGFTQAESTARAKSRVSDAEYPRRTFEYTSHTAARHMGSSGTAAAQRPEYSFRSA